MGLKYAPIRLSTQVDKGFVCKTNIQVFNPPLSLQHLTIKTFCDMMYLCKGDISMKKHFTNYKNRGIIIRDARFQAFGFTVL